MASSLYAILPLMIIVIFLQQRLISGLTEG